MRNVIASSAIDMHQLSTSIFWAFPGKAAFLGPLWSRCRRRLFARTQRGILQVLAYCRLEFTMAGRL